MTESPNQPLNRKEGFWARLLKWLAKGPEKDAPARGACVS